MGFTMRVSFPATRPLRSVREGRRRAVVSLVVRAGRSAPDCILLGLKDDAYQPMRALLEIERLPARRIP